MLQGSNRNPTDGSDPADPGRRPAARLGPLEWGLLTLIVLAIGVTVAMAVFDPS